MKHELSACCTRCLGVVSEAFYIRTELMYTAIVAVVVLLTWRVLRAVPAIPYRRYFHATDILIIVGALGVFSMASVYPLSKVERMSATPSPQDDWFRAHIEEALAENAASMESTSLW